MRRRAGQRAEADRLAADLAEMLGQAGLGGHDVGRVEGHLGRKKMSSSASSRPAATSTAPSSRALLKKIEWCQCST
jgi:hypothetical protein